MNTVMTLCRGRNLSGGCGEVTEHEVLITKRLRCLECSFEHYTTLEMVNARRRDIAGMIQELRGRLIRLMEEERELAKTLNWSPSQEQQPSPWKKTDIALTCAKCGRKTRWTYRGAAMCQDMECRRIREKREAAIAANRFSKDEMRDIFAQMGLLNDDDDSGFEVIEGGRR